MPRLILASGSPRRRQLLAEAYYAFEIIPSDIDESQVPTDLRPSEVAAYLARGKAAVIAARFPDAVVVGADTVVALGDLLLGKPADATDARRMLSLLSGTAHHVTTGVAVCRGAQVDEVHVTSTVAMRPLTATEIDAYVAGRQWEGKAGGYGIQDDDPFVTRMDGSLTNIVGLPMDETIELLARAGVRTGSSQRRGAEGVAEDAEAKRKRQDR
ncbi:MAG TPA: Maf family protein [Tepidisphaeraceae bacterium]|jgi:septum formation protein|nr:Maf family protein [Tepidisphaeraceae bacterium]